MKTKCRTLVALLFAGFVHSASAAWDESAKPSRSITYKTVGEIELKLHVFDPPAATKKPMPAVVFFFGGGWTGGTPAQFYHQANYLARHGFLAISADYRTMSNGKATPAECVKDCKSAIRYVRKHAGELGVDPERIAAGGMSAGGHTAAATGTVKGFEHDDEELSVSSRPNAMVLFNPVYDNSEGGYGYGRVSKYWKEFSPLHNIDKDTPPAIVFFGSKEKLVPIPVMKEFQAKMQALGIKSELKIYDGQGHGFANYGRGGNRYFIATMDETHKFFEGLEWIYGKTDAEEYVASFAPKTTTKRRPAAKAYPKREVIPEGHAFPGEKTEFKGYDRYKMRAGRGNMTVICPKEAAPGKPWMWRSGMFWQAIPKFHETDLKLVEQGYHVVLAAGHVYGHPRGNAMIDAAYDLLTTKYGFAKKCSLASMSRETCALFRWASTHPERVESIYVDNGVLSLRSWPGGAQVPGSTSKFKGHLPSWEGLKKAYGFTSDAEALAAKISPVDLLEPLAKAGVPILTVCGAKDDCCIYEEHDAILEQRYKALGGDITVIIENKGHSHGMKDPAPVLEFIRKHTNR